MATMTMVERLKVAEAAGVKTGRYNPDAPCPYEVGTSEHEAYTEGVDSGRQARHYDEQAQKHRAAAQARRAAFEDRLTAIFGTTEMREEFESWLAEFVDARTR